MFFYFLFNIFFHAASAALWHIPGFQCFADNRVLSRIQDRVGAIASKQSHHPFFNQMNPTAGLHLNAYIWADNTSCFVVLVYVRYIRIGGQV